jgi:nicotinamidase/pyrazinamidase
MKKILLVIDMQNDFINGALGTGEALHIVPQVLEKIKNFDGDIWFTQDTHFEDYPDTQEGKYLPVPHCIKDSNGWELQPYVAALCLERGAHGIEKSTFGSKDLPQELQKNYPKGIASITLIGLCTDICVISNALLLKAFFPETPILVDASCCAGITPDSHRNALEAMKTCQIIIES